MNLLYCLNNENYNDIAQINSDNLFIKYSSLVELPPPVQSQKLCFGLFLDKIQTLDP
jgi:hypothetical protein